MSKFEKLNESAVLPQRGTRRSAGYDLVANESAVIEPRSRKLIKTGLAVKLEDNEYLEIVPRSGLALKKGITVLNAPGIIDADYYPGEIGVILINTSEESFTVEIGDRIAQAILREYKIMEDDIPVNAERDGGFGSTGVHTPTPTSPVPIEKQTGYVFPEVGVLKIHNRVLTEDKVTAKLRQLVQEFNTTVQLYGDFFIDSVTVDSVQALLKFYKQKKEIIQKAVDYIERLEINSIGTPFSYTAPGKELLQILTNEKCSQDNNAQ